MQAYTLESYSTLDIAYETLAAAKERFGRAMSATVPVELSRNLQSIPGIGPYVASSLIGEIQDMSRFDTSKQLIAYVGLDPRVRQSGHSLNSTGRLTKRGSPYLRHAMFVAATVSRQHDPQFKALYDKKRAEGKCYTVAICATARKLLTVVRSVWLSGEPYALPSEH
jgi:transposase